jgi:hypothetical protein
MGGTGAPIVTNFLPVNDLGTIRFRVIKEVR